MGLGDGFERVMGKSGFGIFRVLEKERWGGESVKGLAGNIFFPLSLSLSFARDLEN